MTLQALEAARRITLRDFGIGERAEIDLRRRSKQCVDTYRPPYGRLDVTVPRTSVIVGTTNRAEFLDDETGNRRWWPVRVGAAIDVDKLQAWRDQLWAEAVAAYRTGEPWWLSPAEDATLATIHEGHTTTDPWTDRVIGWAAGWSAPFTTADVLEHALTKPVGQWTRADEMRVAKILTRAGYKKGPRPHGQPRTWCQP